MSRPSKLGKSKLGSLASTFRDAFSSSKKSDTKSCSTEQKAQNAADDFKATVAKPRQTQSRPETQTTSGAPSAIGPAMNPDLSSGPDTAQPLHPSRDSVESNDSMAITQAPKKPDWPQKNFYPNRT